MCGADHWSAYGSSHRRGSPPRVRSRHVGSVADLDAGGITSACAEQTRTIGQRSRRAEDHLRVCGADPLRCSAMCPYGGSPPRVRSRRYLCSLTCNIEGITSACAEQTVAGFGEARTCQDHLRVCGADSWMLRGLRMVLGSPPRVRSRRCRRRARRGLRGITSACAEQTPGDTGQPDADGDHLRVCGADATRCCCATLTLGSPPRVRSRRTGDCVG